MTQEVADDRITKFEHLSEEKRNSSSGIDQQFISFDVGLWKEGKSIKDVRHMLEHVVFLLCKSSINRTTSLAGLTPDTNMRLPSPRASQEFSMTS